MPTRTLRTCKACGRASASDYCPNHEHLRPAAYERATNASAASRGLGHAWRVKRAKVIAQCPICAVCKTRLASEVDHITPRAEGGTDDEDNLQPICSMCHRDKSKRDAARGRRKRGNDRH